MRYRKEIIVFGAIILAAILFTFIFNNTSSTTGRSVSSQVKITPLSYEEKSKVIQTIISSEFIKDVPEKYPVALRFFDFEDGQKIWQDGFLIGHNQLLTSGEPEIYLALHSKYIAELNKDNLCEVIKKANENRDLGFYSDSNKASLLWKYKTMLSHRECFGF